MNNKQIFYALQHNCVTNPFFDGVYPSDILDEIIVRPQLIVVNTAVSGTAGKHWIGIFCEGTQIDIFDAYGSDKFNEHISIFLLRFTDIVNISNVAVQPQNSSICGELCLYFAYFRCLGYSLKYIVEKMGNVEKVVKFVRRNFHICPRYESSLVQFG